MYRNGAGIGTVVTYQAVHLIQARILALAAVYVVALVTTITTSVWLLARATNYRSKATTAASALFTQQQNRR